MNSTLQAPYRLINKNDGRQHLYKLVEGEYVFQTSYDLKGSKEDRENWTIFSSEKNNPSIEYLNE